MDISFEQLKSMVVFAQVVEQGNFSSAAKKLGLSRAVVSYHIKKLEQQFAVQLVNRSTRTMALTEAGKTYYQRCKIVTEQATFAQQQLENIKNEPVGLIKITCPVNLGVELIVPALNQFKHQYPKISLELSLSDDVVNIIEQGFDLAIRGAPLPDSSLKATQLARLSTCICAAPDYFQRCGRPSSPQELEQHKWVLYQRNQRALTMNLIPSSTNAKSKAQKKASSQYQVKLTGEISTNNAAARTAFVIGGHGLGRIPFYDAWPKIQQGQLEQIFADYEVDDIPVYGVFPPSRVQSKKVRLLLDFLKTYFDQLSQKHILAAQV